ncbi:hypothetical protein D3C71_1705490 [compost metagenome]
MQHLVHDHFIRDGFFFTQQIAPCRQQGSNDFALLRFGSFEGTQNFLKGLDDPRKMPIKVRLVTAALRQRYVLVTPFLLSRLEPLLLLQLAVYGAERTVVIGAGRLTMVGGAGIHLTQMLDKEHHLLELDVPKGRLVVQLVNDFGSQHTSQEMNIFLAPPRLG